MPRPALIRWAERYDRQVQDIFAVQDEVAERHRRQSWWRMSRVPSGNDSPRKPLETLARL